MKYYVAILRNGKFNGKSKIYKNYKAMIKYIEKEFNKDETINVEIRNAKTAELIKTYG